MRGARRYSSSFTLFLIFNYGSANTDYYGTSIICPRFHKAIPATLVSIIVVTLIAIGLRNSGIHDSRTVLDFVQSMDPSKTTIAASLPRFAMPEIILNLETLKLIFPFSLLAAAVGLIESLMTLTLVDEITETRGRGNKECIGQGLANVVNGFFGGMGGCAMIGQSMINIRGGGRGRLRVSPPHYFYWLF